MNMYHRAAAGVAIAVALISAPSAHGSTINTYAFTQMGWFDVVSPALTIGNPEPNVNLFGSFTGTVEPDGFIRLGDLTAFSETLATGFGLFPQSMNQLTLFSFDTNGGASTLTVAGSPVFEVNICQGAAVFLTANCTRNFAVNFPAGVFGEYEGLGNPLLVSKSLPQIILESTVTTATPVTTPEPASFVLAGAVLVLFGVHRRRKAAS